MRLFLSIAAMFLTLNAFADQQEMACIQKSTGIAAKLACLKRLKVVGVTSGPRDSATIYELRFQQPVDHNDVNSATFNQRLVLIHRSESEPMVLQTSGYSIFGVAEARVTSMFQTNQIQVEHRFFSDSVPAKLDWEKLDIKQSADDFHDVTVAMKQIYSARWVNTGASKGGMTSVYHRRFYPNDLDGTIADVAPLSFSTDDYRYVAFVDHVGGQEYASCRERLKNLQITLLKEREKIVPKISGEFTHLGSADVGFEHAVIEMPFIFWQYQNASRCSSVPAEATADEAYAFLESVASPGDYSDESFKTFQAYYYQAATQLGAPGADLEYLKGLQKYPYNIGQYMPKGVSHPYSGDAMKDIDQWVRNSGDKIIFVYGEFDPWSGGAFPLSSTGKDVLKLVVPAGNHSAKFTALGEGDKATAIATLSMWFNKAPVAAPVVFKKAKSLEEIELQAIRHRR